MNMTDKEIENLQEELQRSLANAQAAGVVTGIISKRINLCILAKRANSYKALIDRLEEDISGQPSADKLAEGWNDCRKYIQAEFKKLEEK